MNLNQILLNLNLTLKLKMSLNNSLKINLHQIPQIAKLY